MAKVVQVGVTLMRCANLNKKNLESYLSYLKQRGAKIETWDSEEPEDPQQVAQDQLLEPGGFTVWFDKVEVSVSILQRSSTYLARFDCPVSEKTTSKGVLKLVVSHADDLIEFLAPKFGFVDLLGDHPPGLSEGVSKSKVHWLFWLNYFGSEFVASFGKELLGKAPFLEVAKLPNGALKCSTRKLPFEKIEPKRAKELIDHFGGPDRCQIYNAADHPIDF